MTADVRIFGGFDREVMRYQMVESLQEDNRHLKDQLAELAARCRTLQAQLLAERSSTERYAFAGWLARAMGGDLRKVTSLDSAQL
ncbi:MAG: hypothetical protein Greene041619_440 [Candidatus Peregrinibacteria bacterium Greene0416_19]|nr:MAG: hypothetical protein Greene041619_440 [Candidatus Peregrinibacteria bacterium Greene0416_19]